MARLTQIFDRIRAGLFHFDPAVHLQPRAPGLGPVFTPGRIAVLRRKMLLAGIHPDAASLPVVVPVAVKTGSKKSQKHTSSRRWNHVRMKLEEMPKLMQEARERRQAAKLEKKKKLPF